MNQLKSNREYFDNCFIIAQKLYNEGLFENCVQYIDKISLFAWQNFTGYYSHWGIENLLNEISNKTLELRKEKKETTKESRKKILHIVTVIETVGGHSKLLFNWILNDERSLHTVVSTQMNINDLSIKGDYYIKNGDYIALEGESYLNKAQRLLDIVNDYDLVMFHTHPNDTIPILALSHVGVATPVGFVNHADHVFWLGVSVLDILIQIREANIDLDKIRRQVKVQDFLPIPIISETKLNSKINKNKDEIIILSTGTEYKYIPNEKYNFFKELYKIAIKHSNVLIYLAGVYDNFKFYQEYKHERIICLGDINNLSEYEDIADIYLEGFPLPSFTALLQPGLKGVPFVLHYDPVNTLKLFIEKRDYYIIYPKNVDEWHQLVEDLIVDKEFRSSVGEKQKAFLDINYNIDGWKTKLNHFYDVLSKVKHEVKKGNKEYFTTSQLEFDALSMNQITIGHYTFTRDLSFKNKILLFLFSIKKNRNVTYFNFKKFIKR